MRIKKFSNAEASDLDLSIFPQLTGGDGEGDDGDSGQDGEDPGQDDGEDDGDDEGEPGADDSGLKIRRLSREANKRRIENKKLKEQIQQLNDDREEQEKSKKTKLEQAQDKLNEAHTSNKGLSSANERLLLENAVLKDSKHNWHDSSAVIALLDTSSVEIDPESGTIEGIEDALADLAKERPFLVKTAERNNQGSGSSGHQPGAGSGNRKMTEQQRKDDIARKWKIAK